jgi:hypothetical protein
LLMNYYFSHYNTPLEMHNKWYFIHCIARNY